MDKQLSSYLAATKQHNVAMGTEEPGLLEGIWDGVVNTVANIPNFLEATAISTGLGFYNTGVAAVNLFTDDKIEEIKVSEWMQSYDSDLGKYYRENESLVDVSGFVLGSFVPGLGGVKALNVAQRARAAATSTGMIGSNISRATGLLVPQTEAYMLRAAPEIAATSITNLARSNNARKAILGGFQQNILEAAAFETFATAAQWRSNFIAEMDTMDLVVNFATGVGLGGAIGGTLTGFRTGKQIKQGVKALDEQGNAGRFIWQTENPAMSVTDDIFLSIDNKASIEKFINGRKAAIEAGEVTGDMLTVTQKHIADAELSIRRLDAKVAGKITSLMDDKEVGRYVFNTIKGMDTQQARLFFAGVDDLKRVGQLKAGAPKGDSLNLPGMSVTNEVKRADHTWTQMWGMGNQLDKAGRNLSEVPLDTTLADIVSLGKGQTLKDAVVERMRKFKHSFKDDFDALSSKRNWQDVQSRYIYADRVSLEGPKAVMETDIPMLEAALEQFLKVKQVTIKGVNKKNTVTVTTQDDLIQEIIKAKQKMIARGAKRGMPAEIIAQHANVSKGLVDGTAVNSDGITDYFARQHIASVMGIKPEELHYIPKYFGAKANARANSINEMELSVDVIAEQLSQAAQAPLDMAVAKAGSAMAQNSLLPGRAALSNWTEELVENSVMKEALNSASRYGAGAKLFTFANGEYGSLESIVNHIGQTVHKANMASASLVREQWTDVINSFRVNQKSAANFSATMEQLAGVPESYAISHLAADAVEGGLILRPLSHIDALEAGKMLPKLSDGAKDVIKIEDPLVAKAIRTHVDMNSARVAARNELYQAQGTGARLDPRVVYPVKPDPRRHPYVAFVVDSSAGGVPNTTMIHAASKENLAGMIDRVRGMDSKYKVYTKAETEEFRRLLGTYDYNRTLNELELDATLKSRGINSQTMPVTDADAIADRYVNWHVNQSQKVNRDVVTTKYMQEFEALRNLGRPYGNLNASMFPDTMTKLTTAKSNPFEQYIKTALNVSNLEDYPFLASANAWIDTHVSRVWNNGVQAFREMKGIKPEVIDQINAGFKEAGYDFAYKTTADVIFANHPAGTKVLSNFVRTAQSILSTVFLRMDTLHAVNNMIGSVIMTSPELRHVIKGIEGSDAASVGKLAQLAKTATPEGGLEMLSPTKLMAKSYSNLFNKELRARAVAEGFVPADVEEAFKVLDTLSLNGGENAAQLMKKQSAAMEGAQKLVKGIEKYTGNKFAEQANRFVSYDIMRQITDLAIEAGVMTSKEAKSYINTFVNRTQISLNAAQRPVIFQGPVGMAMGLFQSYQFNLMQQMFRYVANGSGKTAAMMMGLQGSFYGLNGLPGFKYLNEQIIGNAPGNTEHRDFESELPHAFGKKAGEFMLYGIPGSIFNLALHSRGDLTPQNPTVLPTSLDQVPIVRMYGRIYDNLASAGSQLMQGADVGSVIVSALEHNSFNRPLSGLTQVMRGVFDGSGQVYSTSKNGEFLASNDLWSLATLARLSGGKPLDEAIVRDFKYRSNFYKQSDRARRDKAAEAIRVSMSGGGDVPAGLLDSSFDVFLNTGGATGDFNRWFLNLVETSTVPLGNRLIDSLKDPYSMRMLDLINQY